MKLYKSDEDKIGKYQTISDGSVNYIVDKLTNVELNTLGYYPVIQVSPPDKRYYTGVKSGSVVGEYYEITYVATERPLFEVQERMLDDLRIQYEINSTRPRVNTGLGYDVYGSQADIAEFVDAKDNSETEIVDADNNIQSVTGVSYTAISTAIKSNRASLRTTGKIKVSEVRALTTIQECIDYENEAYNYTITQEDIDSNPELVLNEIIVKYRNNITDW